MTCSGNFKKSLINHKDNEFFNPASCVCCIIYPFAHNFFQLASLVDTIKFEQCVQDCVKIIYMWRVQPNQMVIDTKEFLMSVNLVKRLDEMISMNQFEDFIECPYFEKCALCESCWNMLFMPRVVALTSQIDDQTWNAIVAKPSPSCPFCFKDWNIEDKLSMDTRTEVRYYLDKVYKKVEQEIFNMINMPNEIMLYVPRNGYKLPLLIFKRDQQWFIKSDETYEMKMVTLQDNDGWLYKASFEIKSTRQDLVLSLFKQTYEGIPNCASIQNFKTNKKCRVDFGNKQFIAYFVGTPIDEFLEIFNKNKPVINPALLGKEFSQVSQETLNKIAKQVKRSHRK